VHVHASSMLRGRGNIGSINSFNYLPYNIFQTLPQLNDHP